MPAHILEELVLFTLVSVLASQPKVFGSSFLMNLNSDDNLYSVSAVNLFFIIMKHKKLNFIFYFLNFQLNLPEGVSVDVVVSSVVDAGHIFVQQHTHPSFPSLERLNQFMMACYSTDGVVPQLPRPIEGKYNISLMDICGQIVICDFNRI